ncbi:HAD family hydrolase [Silicimonas algicola]|uniref:Sulfotransferase family protein n=1 Tax=Silicimonas algicola TaxID=1826607 RepID=A0A316G765_9RHOB|nr:sulfotransferase family protein [Silicimonas algicola]AZQ69437.1 HAD family hydrolase [Silicimonas algicola]PWK56503.1 hypothetical protein C8D95_104175 [Silicimonas algicola]
MKIAMWSGPRNLSTAMLYAFGNRADFAAWDEPFYAAYLAATEIDHPMRTEIIGAHETDPVAIAREISGPNPGGKAHWYMKHMPFHMVDGFPLDWAEECVNVHLIRHPARVVASYVAKRERPTLRDIGFQQQVELYERFPGPVLDSDDIRRDPERMLRRLCDRIGLSFDPVMLAWPAGPKPFDGAWAPHWYGAVHRSTGFAGAEGSLPRLEGEAADLADAALPFYGRMATEKMG